MFEAYSVMQTGKLIIFKGTVVTATNTIFSKFFSSSMILLLESPLNFHAS